MTKKEWREANKDKVRQERIRYKLKHPMRHRLESVYIGAMYRSMRRRAKMKCREMTIGNEDFARFIKNSNYSELYSIWKESEYKRKLSPSIDRIDEKRGYALDNIQILPMGQNISKYLSWVREIKNK